ncbi:cytochrome P450 [Coniophora puteana RWD-64-598 SS2]|uniref:Cytochrome P450 n=1 Tax=Coniophora puteana (strain RWD-64-598) TaxID=741705 RepID=A0A5M3MSG2_CONPW|nr:cytochrome P450 [Coniophora puteana RWD-64-598 SS2]EIW81471.1 cytochrome P450 [Coniophora puteana RWD-64-598 SS2]
MVLVSASVWLFLRVSRLTRRYLVGTRLRGPPRANWFLGQGHMLLASKDAGSLFEGWEKEYGSVYALPTTFGMSGIVLCDPKAVSHFYQYETARYDKEEVAKSFFKASTGDSLIIAVGDSHKRQRKAMTPAFSNAAIRNVTGTFYDSAYKVTDAWTSILEESDSSIIEVQGWMSRVSLDSIGIAGFSHDFGTIDGKHSDVADVLDRFTSTKPSLAAIAVTILGPIFPALKHVPTNMLQLFKNLNSTVEAAAKELIERVRQEKMGLMPGREDKSVIGLLIKSRAEGAELYMSEDEVLSQIKLLLVAGYETTSISLSWALVELAQNQSIQDKLRGELLHFSGNDPTYEQLTNGLPYLDAVVCEILRVHSPAQETTRIATEGDIIPLSEPITDAYGTLMDHVVIEKGTQVTVSIEHMNRSEKLWGPDAKRFVPERWLNANSNSDVGGVIVGLDPAYRAREIQGYKHILSFADGPRMCLGRAFALAEFKAVLCTLVRNFKFEMRDEKAEVEIARGILARPRIVGEEKVDLPLRVTRL